MYLKRLEIQGFKSFANKTVLEFEKGMTAVVGPNGSGKSNVADAIRWVLGEQSLKQIRGKKSEDVIFAGSEKKSKMSFAQVTVTFDNGDKRIPLDYSEVSISRRIDRSGESDYYINGNKVRLLDIIDLVLKSNIGTSRHTVIGQGAIDQMVLSGPGEVKNLIDEASGVKTYYIRREKTLKRLEQTTQNLIRVQDLVTEIEPRLKSLRRQAKRMEERSTIEQELKIYQTEFYSNRYWALQTSINELVSKLDVLAEQKKSLEKEIEHHRNNLDRSEGDNKAEVDAYQSVQNEIKKLVEKKNKILEDVSLIRGKLQAEKSVGVVDGKTLGVEKNHLETQKNSLTAQIETARKDHQDVEQQFKAQQALFQEISEKLNEIQRTLETPENINFQELSEDVDQLDRKFDEFYQNLERASDVSLIISFAQDFKSHLGVFKQKAVQFAQNPFANFEKQRKVLSDVLAQKDRISQELNSLELRRSKVSINLEYAETELAKVEQKLMHVNLDLQKVNTENVDQYFEELLAQEKSLQNNIAAVAKEISDLEQSISQYHSKEQSKKQELLEEERQYRLKQDVLSKLKDQESALQIEKAKFDTQKENIVTEAKTALTPDGFAKIEQEKVTTTTNGLEEKIHRLKNQLDMIGGIDELTLKEYEETEQRYTYLTSQISDLQKGIDDLRKVIEELDGYIKKQFSDSFERINEKFESYFRILFNGGRAYLSAVHAKEDKAEKEIEGKAAAGEDDEDDDEEDDMRPEEKIVAKYEQGSNDIIGIDIKATPPGKKLQSISALSGGERSLTSIALLCALLSCFPSPFVMLDEVDAALDEANTIRFAQILGTLAHSTQFVTVTHNRETMRQAHTLYGVTMGDDSVSKILSIKIEQAQAFAK
jgi:chromosome segregation protein